ncbi:MAG: DHHA1 domain-containing protein [Patescibacteria group bacterium]
MKNIIILYHKDCFDGFGGAWAAYKKFGKNADYFGVEHQTQPPKELKNKEIYLIDFCYQKKEMMEKLLKENRKVVIIDHHISQKEAVKISSEYVYDLKHSGSVLAWKYFHPKKPIPKLLRHIEDIDLWKFKLAGTKELIMALDTRDFNFSVWDKAAKDFENSKKRKKYFEIGKILMKYRQKLIDKLVSRADKAKIHDYFALAVNSPIFQSEIGNALVEKGASVGIIWSQRNGKKYFSLRSNGKVDVSKIAGKFNGGGHKAAAGFSIDIKKPLPWKTK